MIASAHQENGIGDNARAGHRGRLDLYSVLALLLTIFAWAPLLGSSYFMNAHDAHHSLFFPLQFDKGIRDGFWLPRWGPDFAHGYGYPMMVFYAPLSFYIWESFRLTELFGVVASTKATFVVGFLLAAAGIYLYARDLWGRRAALFASLAYTYLPYHLLNIYVRAALAEFMAMALLPWIALAFRRLIRRPSLLGVAAAAGSYGALLGTHNITAVLFTPLLGALILFELWQLLQAAGHSLRGGALPLLLRRAFPVGGSILLGVALATAVWLPALTEQHFIKIEQWSLATYQYADHFVYPSQLLSPFWGFGYSVPGPGDGMAFQLGVVALSLALWGGWALLFRQPAEERPAGTRPFFFYSAALVLLIVLMLPSALALWEIGPFSKLIQFPWRLLAVACFPLALLAGGGARLLARSGTRLDPPVALALLLLISASTGYRQPQMTPAGPRLESQQSWRDYEAKHPDMVAMVAQTEVQPTDSPMLPALEANEQPRRFESLSPAIRVTQLHEGGGSARARVEASEPGTVRFLTYWYPGWFATIDGRPVEVRQDGGPLGLMEVEVPAGEHILAFRFGDPPLRRAANLVTLASLLVLAGLILLGSRQRGRRGG